MPRLPTRGRQKAATPKVEKKPAPVAAPLTSVARNPVTSPEAIIDARNNGLITDDECHDLLDKQQVSGSFEGLTFTGYDYRNRQWIERTGDVEKPEPMWKRRQEKENPV